MNGLENLLGGTLVGLVTSSSAWGVLSYMSWRYFDLFRHDWWGFRCLVVAIWLCQLVQIISVTWALYDYLISHYAEPEYLAVATWQYNMWIGISSLSAFLAQAFYARRVAALWKSLYPRSSTILRPIVISLIGTLAVAQLAFGCICFIQANRLKEFTKILTWTWASTTMLSCITACDVLIAASMCILLHRSRTGATETNRLINRLILYSIQTGLLTSVFAAIALGVFISFGFHFLLGIFSFPLGALYGISLLANLLARDERSRSRQPTPLRRLDRTESSNPFEFSTVAEPPISSRIRFTPSEDASSKALPDSWSGGEDIEEVGISTKTPR